MYNKQSFATAYLNSVHKHLRKSRKYIIPMFTNVLLYGFLSKFAYLRLFLLAAKTNITPVYYSKNNQITCYSIFTDPEQWL